MKVLIIGAVGMVGRKLVTALAGKGELAGKPITHLTLADIVEPEPPPFPVTVRTIVADLSAPARRTC